MWTINRRNFISVFTDANLHDYLIKHYVDPEVLKQKIEKLIIDSNFNSINREELIEQAKAKRIKNYKRIPKEGLVKHLWMSADPCIVTRQTSKE